MEFKIKVHIKYLIHGAKSSRITNKTNSKEKTKRVRKLYSINTGVIFSRSKAIYKCV